MNNLDIIGKDEEKKKKPWADSSIYVKPSLIRSVRKTKGFTQESLSKAVGVSAQTIRNWENGTKNISLKNYYLLCDALDVSSMDLLDEMQSRAIASVIDAYDRYIESTNREHVDKKEVGERLSILAKSVLVFKELMGIAPSKEIIEIKNEPFAVANNMLPAAETINRAKEIISVKS